NQITYCYGIYTITDSIGFHQKMGLCLQKKV
ncbi:MAG: hypothetical protein ACI8SA_001076, partial [Dokdonia sp.]